MQQLDKVKLDIIRYANCWEDADLLLEGLEITSNDNVISIGSAGDNTFSILSQSPKCVVAVDISSVQLYLIELKKCAIQHLEHEAFLKFMGFLPSQTRMDTYSSLSSYLSKECKEYWDYQQDMIQNGIIHQGKFERYFHKFQRFILPLIHSKKRIKELLLPKSNEAQTLFFNKKWNSKRWKWLFQLFFSRFIMGRLGRDPQFLKQVDISVSRFILNRAAHNLSSSQCSDNYFLKYILLGSFGNKLPHYARKENYTLIQENIDKLILKNGMIQDVLEKYGPFDKFNLSNIFEYMPEPVFNSVSKQLIQSGSNNSKYFYWNLMVPRQMSLINPKLKLLPLSNQLSAKDKGFFYSGIKLEAKTETSKN